MSRLKVAYGSSLLCLAMVFMSIWYWAASSASVTVRAKPSGGLPDSSRLMRPVKSFMSLVACPMGVDVGAGEVCVQVLQVGEEGKAHNR